VLATPTTRQRLTRPSLSYRILCLGSENAREDSHTKVQAREYHGHVRNEECARTRIGVRGDDQRSRKNKITTAICSDFYSEAAGLE
jgi:hypothetical protein